MVTHMNLLFKTIISFSILLAFGCRQSSDKKINLGNRQIKIIATTTMIADLVANAGKTGFLLNHSWAPELILIPMNPGKVMSQD